MKTVLNYILLVALALVGLVAAVPTVQDELVPYNISSTFNATDISIDFSPANEYHGYATAEVWVGRTARNVGDIVGSNLYSRVWTVLDQQCGSTRGGKCGNAAGYGYLTDTHKVSQTNGLYPTQVTKSYFGINLSDARYESEQLRRLLIGAVASTIEAMAKNENCYFVNIQGISQMCNVGDIVHVHLPDRYGKKNYMHVEITNYGDDAYSTYKCCPTRHYIDSGIDTLGREMSQVFNQDFSRDVRCMISAWTLCEQCGPKCNECGNHCADVCPKGKC